MEIPEELREGHLIDIFNDTLDRSRYMMAALRLIEDYQSKGYKIFIHDGMKNGVQIISYRKYGEQLILMIEPAFERYDFCTVGYFYELTNEINES